MVSLGTEGCDHCVLPAVKGAVGFSDVKWGDECVWLLLRSAYGQNSVAGLILILSLPKFDNRLKFGVK